MKHTILAAFLVLFGSVAAENMTSFFNDVAGDVLSELGIQESQGQINWNSVADFILDALREDVKKTNREQLRIPDIHQEFNTNIKFVKVSGNLVAHNGWFRNLSTVERTGNVNITIEDKVYTLASSLGLGDIELGFDNYTVKLDKVGLSLSGSISGSVGNNSISFMVEVDTSNGRCDATLKELRVVELDDIRLTLTGFGVLNRLASKLANEAIETRKGDIINKIELALENGVKGALKKVECTMPML